MTAKNIYDCTVQELLDIGVDIDIYFHNVTSKENALSKIKQFADTDPFFDIAIDRSCRWAKHRFSNKLKVTAFYDTKEQAFPYGEIKEEK